MAEKKIATVIKLQIPAGQANPAPPVGPALGAAQVNIMQFCQAFNAATQDKMGDMAFNAATQDKMGDIIPVVITVFEDRTFDFVCKTPPAAHLIKKELKLKGGSAVPQRDKVGQLTDEQLTKIAEIKMPQRDKVGQLTDEQLTKIAEIKMPDLNANDIDAAKKIVAGTARSMGSPRSRCRTSMPTTLTPPRRSSPVPPAPWA